MTKNHAIRLICIVFAILYTKPSVADNLYYYLEKLPPSISTRNYTQFKNAENVLSYIDSCKNVLKTIGEPTQSNLDHYLTVTTELHDIIDQFPTVCGAQPKAHFYTTMALSAIEQIEGMNSERYARYFADYLLYDCKDKLTNKMAYIIGQDAFCPDSTYTVHVRYKLHRHSDLINAIISSLYGFRNSLDKISVKDESFKEHIWAQLIVEDFDFPKEMLFSTIHENYMSLNDIEDFKKSVPQRQQFMDGTGLMLTLYNNDLPQTIHDTCLQEIEIATSIVDRTFVTITGNVSVHRKANYVHVLAYLQAWKSFMQKRGATPSQIATLNNMVKAMYQSVPLMPASYEKAFQEYQKENTIDLEVSRPAYSEDETFVRYLFEMTQKVKKNDYYTQLESLLPPIIPWSLEELHDKKPFISLLDYCAECLDYIDQYYDDSFMWYTDYTSEETIKASEERRKKLIAEGWTGKSGDKYIGINKVLDFSVDYLIRSQGYHLDAAPTLLSRAARYKSGLGDKATALLYSTLANNLYNILDKHPIEWLDNQQILAKSSYEINLDSTLYKKFRQYIPKLEQMLLKEKLGNDGFKVHLALTSMYNTMFDYEYQKNNLVAANYWVNKNLDYLYNRKGSIWYRGGCSASAPNIQKVEVLYRQWLMAKTGNNKERIEDAFNALYKETHMIKEDDCDNFDMIEIPAEVEHINNLYWENRNVEADIKGIMNESERIRQNIQRYATMMNPEMRNRYFKQSQKIISDYNGILANNNSPESAQCIFNNLLLFHGLQLLNERLIAKAIAFDEECKNLLSQSQLISTIKQGELVGLFRSDFYAKRMEERALTTLGLKELLAINYSTIQRNLKSNEIVIEFFKAPFWNDKNYDEYTTNNEYGYYAAVLRATGNPQLISLCSSADLPSTNPLHGYRNKDLNSFAKKIWSPLLPYLKQVDTIYFTPDAELHNIPLEFLPYQSNQTMSDAFTLFRLSSSREILQHDTSTITRNAALFGYMHYNSKNKQIQSDEEKSLDILLNPANSSKNMDLLRSIRSSVEDLPHTRIEINGIHRILRKKDYECNIYSEYQATEEAFKKLSGQAPSIIHVATHGKYWPKLNLTQEEELVNAAFYKKIFGKATDDDALNRSVLLFSGANQALSGTRIENEEDGILTAREISVLDLSNVDLLVLSACQTGLGDIQEDGVFGLQRGFKKAGVNSILMSLWEVDDEATQLLMKQFYNHYLNGHSKNESLRHAQNYLKKIYPHSQKWAAFVLLDAIR